MADTGIALLPQWGVQKFIDDGRLTVIEIEDAEVSISRNPDSGIYLLYNRAKYGLKKVMIAVEFLVAELSPGDIARRGSNEPASHWRTFKP